MLEPSAEISFEIFQKNGRPQLSREREGSEKLENEREGGEERKLKKKKELNH